MSRIEFEPWEPEESVGKLWHAFVSRLDGDPIHDGARVLLSQVGGRLAVLFRGLGGDPAVEIKPVAMETSHHRLSLLRRLGTWAETAPRASFDGATLRLPESLAAFPDPRANAALYLWLAAAAAALRDMPPVEEDDPLLADLAAIDTARAMTEAALHLAPGFRALHADLCGAVLATRRTAALPAAEAAVEARVRARVDLLASGEGTDRVWRQTRPERRDLAVSILLDVSRSTESAIPGHGHDGRSVIDIEREALAALAWGLDACGDSFAIHAFSSLKRQRVFVQEVKGFAEPMAEAVEGRIAALTPGHYTRLGAAIRHMSALLTKESRKRRLLLVITDGKPNDLDHYEGRHGIEDSRMAVQEARRAGHAVFGITVDRDGKSWFPRLFGQGGFAVIAHPEKLTQALPQIYRQLVTG